ncbi:MAG: T9SS type A sorting domain-containing protein [Sphingobacteriia bacterium]|nr:T9SS type A sorting domain-containing protein [Sphingobacteriia bacterium]
MKSIWRDGTPLTFGGTGHGGEIPVSYAFPGNPVTNEGWTEKSAGILPGNKRGLVTTGPITFLSGDTLTLDFALVFARDYEGDNLSSVTLLKERIQQVKDFYIESLGVSEVIPETFSIKVFPNPFEDEVVVETGLRHETITWTVYDLMGKAVAHGQQFNQPSFGINLKSLNKGIYFLSLNNGKSVVTRKVIKI